MKPRHFTVVIAPVVLIAVCLSAPAPSAAQQPPSFYSEDSRKCIEIAAPAVKAAKAEVLRKSSAEIQSKLPDLLERFAGRPELPIVLACLMRRETAR